MNPLDIQLHFCLSLEMSIGKKNGCRTRKEMKCSQAVLMTLPFLTFVQFYFRHMKNRRRPVIAN